MNQIHIKQKISENKLNNRNKAKVIIDSKNYLNKVYNNSDNSENILYHEKEIDIGNNYRGKLNQIIKELKNKNNYNELFLNTISNSYFNHNNKKIKIKIKSLNKFKSIKIDNIKSKSKSDCPTKLTLTTAEQLQNSFKKYEEIKQELK